MAGPWDNMTKRMIEAHPEDFVNWLASGTTFVTALDIELKSQHIFADALLSITKGGKPGLLHFEVQTYHDPEIEVRLLEYNILASRQYDRLPVSSYVICLREEADVAEPPFIRHFLDEEGEEVHRFSYRVIRVWLIPTEVLLQSGRMGLLPLVTLTQGGKQPEAVNTMITRLAEAEEWDLLAISRLLGGFVFKKEAEREWFRKRFTMHQDILRDSWVYQEIGQEFLEQGREEERKQRLQDLRQMMLSLVQLHFPEITEQASQQAESITDPELLKALSLKLLAAQELDEAKKILFEADKH
jgi:predicted transposase YdaD